ncbi:hypothetical protein M378DRAFT_7288 [Amanita muscaria Koide BX008]|uniref:Uncharacterized protein n=1 Tax=Amanita muscaria (strain Koide BX008) TaxID=946122 RepID=A0A0C2T3J1_AMAMK|nr:hypothetical protein M378DRAFT_7288 [Amanita muscaria Koide BX008]
MKPSRKTHKDRYSITHLSSETTATLPEYVPASTTTPWQPPRHSRSQQHARTLLLEQLSDQPPEYPDSADEADEETDSVSSETYDGDNVQVQGRPLLLPPHPPGGGASGAAAFIPATRSPRHHGKRISLSTSPPDHYPSSYHHYTHHRHRQFYNSNRPYLHHSRKFRSTAALPYPSPTEDPYLDSLLERSVHALEMSNTLLQSSIPTRTSSSAPKTPSYESRWVVDEEEEVRMDKFEERANGLTKRHEERREQWVDDLEKIKRDVEGLFGEDEDERWEGSSTGRRRQRRHEGRETDVSQSLPASSSRRPSQLDLQETASRLTYSPQCHSRLISPAPGALTHYIAAPAPESELSILGTRVTTPASLSTVSLHSALVMPQVTDRLPEPTTPAYNMLASFVHRTPPATSSTPSSFTTPSVFGSLLPKLRPRASSSSGTEKDRRSSIDKLRSTTSDRLHGHRPMTPPAEVSTSSSSDDLIAKQTVMSLRKILDEQPARPTKKKYKPPAFMPITPAPAPQASTSNATASVSRLFTKAIHTSSTRPPSPPRHSALKHGPGSRSSISAMQQIQPTPSTSSEVGSGISTNWPDISWTKSSLMKAQFGMLPEILNAGVAKAFGATSMTASGSNSATSSGQSTPKRISFAELPEVERPQGNSLRFQEKQQARKKRRRSKGLSVVSGNDENGTGATLVDAMESGSPLIGGGWWSGWLGGDGGGGLAGMGGGNAGMYVSRMEDRVSRPWSGVDRPGIGFGDWAV